MEFELPLELQESLLALVKDIPHQKLIQAGVELTSNYRTHHSLFSKEEKLAYLITRMPATYAVIYHLLQKIQTPIGTMLDLGAGPGTSLWAAAAFFPSLTTTLIEKDPDMISLGKRLTPSISPKWKQGDITTVDIQPHDLILLSYVIGELPISDLTPLIEKAWKNASQYLLIIEPGTPHGFERIRLVRDKLTSLGCHILAPCPHANACPMANNDWCHFSRRIPRTSLHRIMKSGTLGYEDEKFSYLIASKAPTETHSRILRHPQRHPGHVTFSLCTPDGLQTKTLSRKLLEYKKAKKLEWGDEFTYCKSSKELT